MKLIVNSKALAKLLKPVFKDAGETVAWFALSVDGAVTIATEYNKYETFTEPVKKDWIQSNKEIPFVAWRWHTLYRFLKWLPEQPVVLEIDNDGNGLKLTQFVVTF